MGIKVKYTKRSHGVTGRSGHIYSFKYSAYENDPNPTAIMLNDISGIHPNTGHQHRYMQFINLSYIPRKDRKNFIKIGKREMEKGNNLKLTGQKVKTKYPYLKFAIRRYMTKPNYYIRNAREIPIEDGEKEVIRSGGKDFSKTIRRKIAAKLKGLFSGKRR